MGWHRSRAFRRLRPLGGVVAAAALVVALGALGSASVRASDSQTPAVQVAQATGLPAAGAIRTDLDDFSFDSFSAEYRLGVDDDGRSTLLTTETLVARFPSEDQNRGIVRALVTEYQGHPTDLKVLSVTDAAGSPRDFELETDDEFLLVRSVARDFVHGLHTYVITYEQRNVTLAQATGPDEFYWDVNGTGWNQPFGSVSARIIVDEAIAGRLTGASACYAGYSGSTNHCDIHRVDTGPGAQQPGATIFTAEVHELLPRQNVTVAIGFEPGTFVPRDNSYLASWAAWFQLLALLGALGTAAWAIVLRATRTKDAPGRPVIVAEYLPPRDHDLFTAAEVLGRTQRTVAAQLLELAVNGHVRLLAEDRLIGRDRYSVQLLRTEGLTGRRIELVRALFGHAPVIGAVQRIGGGGSEGTRIGKAVHAMIQRLRVQSVVAGLRRRVPTRVIVVPALIAGAMVLIGILTAAAVGEDGRGGPLPFLVMLPIAAAALTVGVCLFRRPLTPAGAELRDHLRGMERYIRVAEQERLRVLQSPQGAERTPVDPNDRIQLLRLNERMLPYAVLFGLERQWAAELATLYQGDPDWYSGTAPFTAAGFAAGVSSISSAAASSYSGSSSSSSSGGSGGGGSSGGGGGGGGGGGA